MKRIVRYLLAGIVALSICSLHACTEKTGIEGTWIMAYSQSEGGEREPSMRRVLFDFEGNLANWVTIGDLSTGELAKVLIRKGEFSINGSDLVIKIQDEDEMVFQLTIWADSLMLNFDKPVNTNLIFRRLQPSLKSDRISRDCFVGSHVIKGRNYQDSLDFINDTLLIYTGKYNMNFPSATWDIVNYKEFHFLNIHDELAPFWLIRSCSDKEINLELPQFRNLKYTLTPTRSSISKSNLFGTWKELDDGQVLPPKPHSFTRADQLLTLNFATDKMTIDQYRKSQKLKWDISHDGKRIYFIDQILKNEGSWKILDLNEDVLTIRISKSNGFREEILRLKRFSESDQKAR